MFLSSCALSKAQQKLEWNAMEIRLNILKRQMIKVMFLFVCNSQTGGKRLDSSLFKPVTDHQILSRLPAAARSHVSNLITTGQSVQHCFYSRKTAHCFTE